MQDELKKTLSANIKNNYMLDIAGKLGATSMAPTLTNVPNTLIVSAHGSPISGFSPDATATNQLARLVKDSIEKGKKFDLGDIAKSMGLATNQVKRAVIDSCYAAGYNFEEVKRLFPNLEQLIAPSTDVPTSGSYLPYLTSQKEHWKPYVAKGLSPFFSITPQSTNVVKKAADWMTKEQSKTASTPLPIEQQDLINRYGKSNADTYVYHGNSPLGLARKAQEVIAWGKQRYAKAKSREEINQIEKEVNKKLEEIFGK